MKDEQNITLDKNNPLLDDVTKSSFKFPTFKLPKFWTKLGTLFQQNVEKTFQKHLTSTIDKQLEEDIGELLRQELAKCPKCGTTDCLSPSEYRARIGLANNDTAYRSMLMLRSCQMRQHLRQIQNMNVQTSSGKTVCGNQMER